MRQSISSPARGVADRAIALRAPLAGVGRFPAESSAANVHLAASGFGC